MSYQCIGQSRIKGTLVRCSNESETPSHAAHPEWGWLCAACSNAPPTRFSPMAETTNLNATQCEPREYRDQMESGFMLGMRGMEQGEDD